MTDGDTIVVDASVAVKWYVPEVDSDRAARILESDHALLAPDLMLVEFGNVLWKKTRRGELLIEDANDILNRRVASRRITYISISPLVQAAFEIATQYKHPIYDALYIAVAAAHKCRLVTADERLIQAFRDTPIEPLIVSVASF